MVFFFGFGKTTGTFCQTWKPLYILDCALFVVYFLPNMLFLLVCGNLTGNCISYAHLVAVYTVKYTKHTLLFVFNDWKSSINLWCCSSVFENTDRTFLPTFKALNMLDGTLFVVFLLVNMLFLLFWGILTLNIFSRKDLVAVYTLNTPR